MQDFETEFDKYYKKALDLLHRTGSAEEAFNYVRAIEDEDFRARTFGRVGRFLAAQGNLEEALRYCSAIPRPLDRADALFEIGLVLKENSNPDAAGSLFRLAAEAAQGVECPYDRASVLLQVADQLDCLSSKDEALTLVRRAIELAKPFPQDFEASKTLRGCARALARWNHLPEAIAVAESIDPQWSALRETTLAEVQGRGRWPVRSETDQG